MRQITEFKPLVRPVPFTVNSAFLGPDPNDPCPCGSSRPAGECHVTRGSEVWKLPPYAPLLTGPRTGISCNGCYASFTNDCCPKRSNEHWLSEGLIVAAGHGQTALISGLRWQKGSAKVLPAAVMGANILCERHNHALYPLDAAAISVFSTLDHYQVDQGSHPDSHGSEFDLFSGEMLERWLLKLLWGGASAGVLARAGQPIDDLRKSANRDVLADYLFRAGSLPSGWGLYVEGKTGAEVSADANVAVGTRSGPDGAVWSGSVAMGAVEFHFALGRPRASAGWTVSRRPHGVYFNSLKDPARKLLALGWDHGKQTAKPVTFTYQRPA